MIETELLQKQDDDNLADFRNVFDFDEVDVESNKRLEEELSQIQL